MILGPPGETWQCSKCTFALKVLTICLPFMFSCIIHAIITQIANTYPMWGDPILTKGAPKYYYIRAPGGPILLWFWGPGAAEPPKFYNFGALGPQIGGALFSHDTRLQSFRHRIAHAGAAFYFRTPLQKTLATGLRIAAMNSASKTPRLVLPCDIISSLSPRFHSVLIAFLLLRNRETVLVVNNAGAHTAAIFNCC